MEYVNGNDLAKHVQTHGPLEVDQALAILRQLAVALQYVHEQGVARADRDAEIAGLREQEAELGELVAALARKLPAMPDFDAEPFAGQTAQLTWPAEGPLLKRFGQSRADGSLKWNGVLLGATAGSDVRAVYHGRVGSSVGHP